MASGFVNRIFTRKLANPNVMPIMDKLELALDCKPICVTEASGKQETRRFYFPPLANAPGSENNKYRFQVFTC